jgi:uncharacterized pyridoxal phosphate-containing UPF0001 family protein
MAYYKVKNITNTLAKRDSQKDSKLTITLNNGLFPSDQSIGVGQDVLIECMRVPTELQKLRVKGLVTIVEVSKNEYLNRLKENEKPKQPEPKKEEKPTTKKTISSSSKKSSSSKSKSNTDNSETIPEEKES